MQTWKYVVTTETSVGKSLLRQLPDTQIIVMAAQNVNLILSLAMLRASEAVNVALSKIFK